METILSFIYRDIVLFLVLITILVFVHELGHFLFARLFKINVKTFSIGFGKELIGFTDKSKTRWRISLIPLGGYVSMQGDNPLEADSIKDINDFYAKSPIKRMLVVFAGPMFNVVLAFLIFAFIAGISGLERLSPSVASVLENSPAKVSGIQAGDLIKSVNGVNVMYFDEMAKIIAKAPAKTSIQVERNGKTLDLLVDFNNNSTSAKLGIMADVSKTIKQKLSPFQAIKYSASIIKNVTVDFFKFFKNLFIGNASSKDLGSVLKIADISAKTSENGFSAWMFLLGLISLNLALINFIPLPALDGGHFLLYLIEAIFPKLNNRKIQKNALKFGFVILITLMVLAIANDIYNIFLDKAL